MAKIWLFSQKVENGHFSPIFWHFSHEKLHILFILDVLKMAQKWTLFNKNKCFSTLFPYWAIFSNIRYSVLFANYRLKSLGIFCFITMVRVKKRLVTEGFKTEFLRKIMVTICIQKSLRCFLSHRFFQKNKAILLLFSAFFQIFKNYGNKNFIFFCKIIKP